MQPGAPWPKFSNNVSNTGVGVGSGSNGLVRWSIPFSVYAPVVAADGTIYTTDQTGVRALNPDGTTKWYGGSAFPVSGTGLTIGYDGTLYVPDTSISGNCNLVAMNPSGTTLWSFAEPGATFTSPTIGADNSVYVGSTDPNSKTFLGTMYGVSSGGALNGVSRREGR
ncbi:MAG: PQQ-binding-like beta-propeller repeat protein [Fimbriimonas sp.]|nr:PQQ-binding-like beta-propeller repeat protein [Fimbriimonas sp.]